MLGDVQVLGGPWKGLAVLALMATDRRPVWSPRQSVCGGRGSGRGGGARDAAAFIAQAAPTKDRTPRALKQQRFMVSLFWRLGV